MTLNATTDESTIADSPNAAARTCTSVPTEMPIDETIPAFQP